MTNIEIANMQALIALYVGDASKAKLVEALSYFIAKRRNAGNN
jgi:hypothetical protein